MKNMNLAAFAVAAIALTACDQTTFSPSGAWEFTVAGVEGTATYLDPSHNVSYEFSFEEISPSTPVPAPITATLTYNAAASTVTVSGTDFPVVDRVATIAEVQMVTPAGAFNCELTEYQSYKIHFNAAGSTSKLRLVHGFSLRDTAALNNCSAALTPLKMVLLAGGAVPSDLQAAANMGLIKATVLDQLRSFEVAQVADGENTSASQSLDGGVTETMTASMNADEIAAFVKGVRTALIAE